VETPPAPVTRRVVVTRRNALRLIAGASAASLLDAAWIEPASLSITRRDLKSRSLPPALDGMRIGVLADFHFRPGQDDELIHKVVSQVRGENLDLIALAGDFADTNPAVLDPLMEHLRKLKAIHGIFAVMGNHDGWNAGRSITRQHFEKAGISFLVNQNSLLSIRGETLAVAGTDFVWRGRPDPVQTLKGIPASTPILALVHEPDYFDDMAACRDVMLQVSGHTHGGQCQVPVFGYAPVSVTYGRKYNYGAFERGGSQLFVTRGVGTTGPRVRFSCPPELAV
jgi:predicted MPP superfamily phosphohydrolase